MARLLLVDDDHAILDFLSVLLRRQGHEVVRAESLAEFRAAVGGASFDLVLTDFRLGADSGLEVVKEARALPEPPEVIVLTAYGTAASAVEAMRRGAYDYITKPFDNEELVLLVQRALEKRQLAEQLRQFQKTLAPHAPYLTGSSAAMREVWRLVDKVAASRATVLVCGESGTGKEVVARAIHARSRSEEAFLPVNCAAISEGLLESELFGHVKGAFTGATADRTGILATAGRGTVLLDEIGELPLGTQAKLLRVLQERRVKPVGSPREVPFEARLIAATNRTLEDEVKAGRFREDLYFRLNVITIDLPPLKERREDIVPLARYFLARVSQDLGRPGLAFTDAALKLLEAYSWTGNVRQLQNVVERAATLADGDTLGPESLPPALRGEAPTVGLMVPHAALAEGFSLERHLDGIERGYLLEALRQAGGVKTKAAELLGLTFRSFRYRLAKQGLSERDGDVT